jgi:hypothetical protein
MLISTLTAIFAHNHKILICRNRHFLLQKYTSHHAHELLLQFLLGKHLVQLGFTSSSFALCGGDNTKTPDQARQEGKDAIAEAKEIFTEVCLSSALITNDPLGPFIYYLCHVGGREGVGHPVYDNTFGLWQVMWEGTQIPNKWPIQVEINPLEKNGTRGKRFLMLPL